MKTRLDQRTAQLGLVSTRSQAESYIKLGQVKVDGNVITKPDALVGNDNKIAITAEDQYVSRAALKLASVASMLKLNFKDKVVLDVGSSTGGFTDFALRQGARKIVAVELGSDQLHPSLRSDPRVELHEKTDIRDFVPGIIPDIVVADLSFVSLRDVLPSISKLASAQTPIVVMVKPQFEARQSSLKHKGVIKNDRMRRHILKDFEAWAQSNYVILGKADSAVQGAKGNQERFYVLRKHD